MAGNNKIQAQIEFIVGQQAQFSVDIQLLKERLDDFQTKSDKRMTRIETVMVRFYEDTSTKLNALIDSQLRLENVVARNYEDTTAKLNALIDSQMKLSQAQHRTDRKLGKTDERLGSLIDAVDRLVRNGRNGKPAVRKSASKKPAKKPSGHKASKR